MRKGEMRVVGEDAWWEGREEGEKYEGEGGRGQEEGEGEGGKRGEGNLGKIGGTGKRGNFVRRTGNEGLAVPYSINVDNEGNACVGDYMSRCM